MAEVEELELLEQAKLTRDLTMEQVLAERQRPQRSRQAHLPQGSKAGHQPRSTPYGKAEARGSGRATVRENPDGDESHKDRERDEAPF